MIMLFTALHESGIGIFRTCRGGLTTSVLKAGSDIPGALAEVRV